MSPGRRCGAGGGRAGDARLGGNIILTNKSNPALSVRQDHEETVSANVCSVHTTHMVHIYYGAVQCNDRQISMPKLIGVNMFLFRREWSRREGGRGKLGGEGRGSARNKRRLSRSDIK